MKRASGASFVSIILLLCMDASPVLTHHNFTLIAHTAMLSKCIVSITTRRIDGYQRRVLRSGGELCSNTTL